MPGLLSKACFPKSLLVTNSDSRRSIHARLVIHTLYTLELLLVASYIPSDYFDENNLDF